MQISNEMRAMILRRRPGYSLEAPFYQSKEVFDLDMKAIFGRHWIYVGVEPDIPEPGDYFTVPMARASVVVVRDDDMSIRAFQNVCRHRGARLCDGHKGSVGNIVCPYHQWTYDLTGNLIHTEHMGESFDRSQFRLNMVHVGVVGGLIFICLADEPPTDFEDLRREMEPYIAPHCVADCKVAFEEDLIENGNWKLTMENNRECYHCKHNHPELTISLYEFGFGYQPSPENASEVQAFKDLTAQEHSRWESCGLPSVEREYLDTRITAYRTERLPLDKAGESQTMSSKVACQRLLGDLTQRNLGGLSFWTQPNSWHHFMSDHIVTFSVLPIDPEHTLLRTKWLVHKDAVEGRDYDPKELSAVWHATNKQDGGLVERTHLGAQCPGYKPGPYSPFTEELVEKFMSWYFQRLRAETGLSSATVTSLASG
ncbi:MAG: aromatic ring-hydroxylating dioxygenase subunit alpha [Hyphomicrobium sp.]|uniref:aromatic ring-hydroxylating oxygenase subunit alpha n=1 Tax=Hyphomicrobium sp. TaxID=82 RepID=UPI003D0E00A7